MYLFDQNFHMFSFALAMVFRLLTRLLRIVINVLEVILTRHDSEPLSRLRIA